MYLIPLYFVRDGLLYGRFRFATLPNKKRCVSTDVLAVRFVSQKMMVGRGMGIVMLVVMGLRPSCPNLFLMKQVRNYVRATEGLFGAAHNMTFLFAPLSGETAKQVRERVFNLYFDIASSSQHTE